MLYVVFNYVVRCALYISIQYIWCMLYKCSNVVQILGTNMLYQMLYQIISNSMSLQREMRNIDVYYNVARTGVAAGCMKARQRGNWATLTGGWSQASRVLVVGVLEVIIVGAELCTV